MSIEQKIETLMEAVPYLSKYQGKIVVIKYGGNAMINEELKANVIRDVVLLKTLGLKPVLCHGGGPGINKMLEQLDIPVQFINGLRYTSPEIMRVVEDVFSIVILLQPKGAEGLEAEEENRKIRVEMTKEAWKEFCRREGTQKEMWILIEARDIMVLA